MRELGRAAYRDMLLGLAESWRYTFRYVPVVFACAAIIKVVIL